MDGLEKYKNLFPFQGKISRISLIIPNNLQYVEWENIGDYLKNIERSVQWWMGDWLNYGEHTYGEKYSQALYMGEYEYQTLANFKWVSSRVEFSVRTENLSWEHHKVVAPLIKKEQVFFLNIAVEEKLSVRELKELIRKHKKELNTPSPPEGKFDVIVIDPPWPIEKIEREVRHNQVRIDYDIMSEEELLNLTIPYADNCHIWLWTTHKFIPLAFEMLTKWETKYICTFVWHKPGGFQPVGLPQYNCEFVLYARMGTPEFIDTKKFSVCFNATRGKHSEKPEEFYEMISRVTKGKRIDMFGRRKINGFVSWGMEAVNE